MPSPTDTLLRTQDSPVPTHTTFELVGSMVTAPIDCTSGLSNTELNVVPPFTDFHTPPLAAPANTVSRPWSCAASTAAMRPLMTAEPMLRAGNPETVAESNLMGACAMALTANTSKQTMARQPTMGRRFPPEHAIDIILKSSQTTIATENTALKRFQIGLLFCGRHLEVRIIQGNIRFNFVDRVSGVVARVFLRAGVDRKRVIDTSNLLV